MKFVGGYGKIAGLPVKGGTVSIDAADAPLLLGAAAGLSKALFVAGGSVLGLAVLASILEEAEIKKSTTVPIGTLAKVQTPDRHFLGVFEDDFVEFDCEGQHFKVSLDRITTIDGNSIFGFYGYTITLIDESRYYPCKVHTAQLNVLSMAGRQILMPMQRKENIVEERRWFGLSKRRFHQTVIQNGGTGIQSIKGVTVADIDKLRERLIFTVNNGYEMIVQTIGADVLRKYFIPNPQ